jgi:Zn-dependent protease with chaperone function
LLLPIETVAALLILEVFCRREYPVLPGSGITTLAVLSSCLLLLAASYAVSRIVYLRLRHQPGRGRGNWTGYADIFLRALAVAIFFATLHFFPFTHVYAGLLGEAASVPVRNLCGIVPFVLLCFMTWLPCYRLHRAVTPGKWTLPRFLLHKIRYGFFILIIWLPFLWVGELLEPGEGANEAVSSVLEVEMYGVFALAAWVFPFALRFFWGCKKLRDGEVLARIGAVQQKAGVKFSGVFVWDFGGDALANAAAVGVMPPFRYLFLSRALLRVLSPEELDAVVCHEMGHVRHRHLIYYLVLIVAAMRLAQELLIGFGLSGMSLAAGMILLLLAIIRFGFGFYSLRMERQADLYALEVQGSAEPLCRALEKIAAAAGMPRRQHSWHHWGIAERVDFLRAAEKNPAIVSRHHAHVRGLVLPGLAVSLAYLMFSVTNSNLLPPPDWKETRWSGLSEKEKIVHWEAVARVLPDDPRGPYRLALIYLNGNSPRERELALAYAREAQRRARNEDDRMSIGKLLEKMPGEIK